MFSDLCLFIRDLGFPIFVAVFLLTHFSRTIRALTFSITELTVFLKSKNGGK